MNGMSHPLTTSLLAARMGHGAVTPLTEHQFVDRLRTAVSDRHSRLQELVTAIYVGLKLQMTVCVSGSSRERTAQLFDAVAGAIVGAQSDQTLRLRGPVGNDAVGQRFMALRLGEFVSAAADGLNGDSVWFLIAETAGDPAPMLRWMEREVRATMRANGSTKPRPGNLFVLVAANEPPSGPDGRWLSLAAPFYGDAPVRSGGGTLPPVGYQRCLLDHLLTPSVYRRRLRSIGQAGARGRLARRWLAASVDDQGRGLWAQSDVIKNAREALGALERLQACSRSVTC